MSAIATKTQSEIKGNKIMVYSKSYCPHCTAAKSLLKSLGVEFNAIELDKVENGSEIQAHLAEISGQRTVPNIYVAGKHLGGNDSLQSAHKSGALAKML